MLNIMQLSLNEMKMTHDKVYLNQCKKSECHENYEKFTKVKFYAHSSKNEGTNVQ